MKGFYGITLGALNDPLEQQLQRQGFTLRDRADLLQAHANAITQLLIAGIFTEAEADRARKRLMREINSAVRHLPGTTTTETTNDQ